MLALSDLPEEAGASDLLQPPEGVDEDEAPLSSAELARVLKRAQHALHRARGRPGTAPPAATPPVPAPPPEAVKAERERVSGLRAQYPLPPPASLTPAFSIPLRARTSPSGTWDHQESARYRPRPSPFAGQQAKVTSGLVGARAAVRAQARDGDGLGRSGGRPQPSRPTKDGAPQAHDVAADAWWARLASARTGNVLLSESEVSRIHRKGAIPQPQPLASRHDLPTEGNWIRLSEQVHAEREKPVERLSRRRHPATFGMAPRASSSGTWPHQAAVRDAASHGNRTRHQRPESHDFGSFLPIQTPATTAARRPRLEASKKRTGSPQQAAGEAIAEAAP